ncbi:tripartite tricarboxylate transporter substrate binding protein [Diaphorobacter ruginosibacter]|uniref:Bug family tripartite tricarboxylate transporter substrate binding protein n=1 Tax=Diaphorobacter ruginosibacter TaxID=1715720 RepID=UPI00333EBFB3
MSSPMIHRRQLLQLGAGLSLAHMLPAGAAAPWPAKPIRIIAGQAPGSSNDSTARALADYFSQKLGVGVIVENKPGALGMIAAEAVARSEPDGYTLLMSLHSQPAQAPVLLKRMPLDPDKDLLPVAAMGVGPVTAVVNKDFAPRTLAEVIAYAKARPVNVGNYSIGSGWQMMLEQLAKDTGAQFNVVHYKGTGAMLLDLYAGTVDMGAGSLAGVGGGIDKGAIRPVAIVTGERSNKLPGIPTWADAGFIGPVYQDLTECNMLFAPAGTPQAITLRLAELVSLSVSESARVQSVRNTLGAEDTPLVGDALKQYIARTWAAYRKVTREMRISVG